MVNAMESGNSPNRGSSSETAPTAGAFGDLGCMLASLPAQLELSPCLGSLGQSAAALASAAGVLGTKLGLASFLTVSAKQPLPSAYRFGPYATKLAKQPSSTISSNWKVRAVVVFFKSILIFLVNFIGRMTFIVLTVFVLLNNPHLHLN